GQGCRHAPSAGTCGNPGTPSTVLFVNRAPQGFDAGTQLRLTSPDLQVFGAGSGVEASAYRTSYARVAFYPPDGQQLLPGVYENAAAYQYTDPSRPTLTVSAGLDCDARGRFVVHEASYGPGGEVIAF